MGGGPPREAALRKPLAAQPVALPIIHQECERRAGAVPEDTDGPAEGLFPQPLTAHRRQAINACANIDRLGRAQDPAVRGELQQQRVSKKVRSSAATGTWGACQWRRRRAPSARWRSTSVAWVGSGQGGGGVTSTKPSTGTGASGVKTLGGTVQCCVSVVLFTPHRLATRPRGNLVAQRAACRHSAGGIGPVRLVRW